MPGDGVRLEEGSRPPIRRISPTPVSALWSASLRNIFVKQVFLYREKETKKKSLKIPDLDKARGYVRAICQCARNAWGQPWLGRLTVLLRGGDLGEGAELALTSAGVRHHRELVGGFRLQVFHHQRLLFRVVDFVLAAYGMICH